MFINGRQIFLVLFSWWMAHNVYHPSYHLVDPSPWPLVGALGAFMATSGGVMYFHNNQPYGMVIGFIIIACTMVVWCVQGHHTRVVRQGLKYGMILFILSEVCYSLFWAFFHSSLTRLFK